MIKKDKRGYLKTIMILLLFTLLVLVGCEKKIDLEFVNPRNTESEINDVQKLSLSNLSLKNAKFNINANDLREITIIPTTKFLEREQAVWDLFIGNNIDSKNIINDPRYVPPGPSYVDENKGIYASIGSNGFFTYENADGEGLDSFSEPKWSCVLLENGPIYAPNGRDLTQILNAIQPQVDQMAALDNMQWAPFRVSLVEKNGEEFYRFEYRKSVGEIATNVILAHYFSTGEDCAAPLIDIECDADGNIVKMSNQVIFEVDSENTCDSILSLKSATRLASKELTNYVKYDVAYVEIAYRLFKTVSPTIDREAEPEKIYFMYMPGYEYVMKPYWMFYISLEYGKEIYVMVDCKTGEVEVVNNSDRWTY